MALRLNLKCLFYISVSWLHFLNLKSLFICIFKLDFESQIFERHCIFVTSSTNANVHKHNKFTNKPLANTSRKRNCILERVYGYVRYSFCFPESIGLSQQWANEKHYVCFKGSLSLSLSSPCSSQLYIRNSCGVWGWMNGSLWFGCHSCIRLCFFLPLETGMTKVLEQCNLMFLLWHCYAIKSYQFTTKTAEMHVWDVEL